MFWSSWKRLGAGAVLIGALTSATTAQARDHMSIGVDGAYFLSWNDETGRSAGFGFQFEAGPDDTLHLGAGGYALFGLGEPRADQVRHDIFDLNVDVGFRLPLADFFIPIGTIGLDLVSITTRTDPDTLRGVTPGAHATLGITGFIGRRFEYRLTATVLGALVPGSGEELQGIIFRVGIGARPQRLDEEEEDDRDRRRRRDRDWDFEPDLPIADPVRGLEPDLRPEPVTPQGPRPQTTGPEAPGLEISGPVTGE